MQLVPSIYVGMKQVPHLIQYARRQYATCAFRKSKRAYRFNRKLITPKKGKLGYDPETKFLIYGMLCV